MVIRGEGGGGEIACAITTPCGTTAPCGTSVGYRQGRFGNMYGLSLRASSPILSFSGSEAVHGQ